MSCKIEYCKPRRRYLDCDEEHCSDDCIDNPENKALPAGMNEKDYMLED